MKAYRFQLPFKQPINLKGQTYAVREGVLVERDGRWAEASPLPGFSEETIDDVIEALRGDRHEPCSLQFAMSALETPLIVEDEKVPWNFLLLGDAEQVLASVDRCVSSESRAAKLKIGRDDLKADVELVKEVRFRLPEYVKLRLDANQAWKLDEATTFIESISGVEIEYIEEPLQDADQLEELFSQTGVRYALDETLLRCESLERWPNATALICKPTILGGRNAIRRLAATGKPVVFSAAFESGVGICRIVQLAKEFSPTLAAGLDTLDWLAADLLVKPPAKKGGWFSIAGEPEVDESQLERIL